MGRITLKVGIKPEAGEDKLHVVRIRLIKDRVVRYWALNLSVPKTSFNESGSLKLRNWIKSNHPDHESYNKRIYAQVHKAEGAVAKFEQDSASFTVDEVLTYIKLGGKPDTLLEYFERQLVHRKALAGTSLQKLRTVAQYRQAYDKLVDYLTETKQTKLAVRQLTKSFVLAYKVWLIAKFKHNTVSLKLAFLRQVCRVAMKEKYIPYDEYPFDGVSITFKRRTVNRLRETDLGQLADNPRTIRAGNYYSVTDSAHARPCALLMFYLQGIRIGDFLLLKRENYHQEEGQVRMIYTMGKTDKVRNVLLPPVAIDLMQPYLVHEDGSAKKGGEYLFPYIIPNLDKLTPDDQLKFINRATVRLSMQLKLLGEDLGLTKKLTPHILRHSFADLLRRNHVDILTIQMTLGHSDLRTTRGYLEAHDQGAVDSVVALYDKKTVGKQFPAGPTDEGNVNPAENV